MVELTLVMPVYNEEGCIAEVVQAWREELSRLQIDFTIIVLNDGSNDGTANSLAQFQQDDRIRIIHKVNSGHGPTILMGYRMAAEEADWVFQTDSDNEMSPHSFPELWNRRNDYDALFGYRFNRRQSFGRKLISAVSGLTIRLFFGRGIVDANTPYRLIRAPILKQITGQIPDDTFAPNVILSGELAASGARLFNYPVPHENRKSGSISIVRWKLWKSAMRSFRQTLHWRLR